MIKFVTFLGVMCIASPAMAQGPWKSQVVYIDLSKDEKQRLDEVEKKLDEAEKQLGQTQDILILEHLKLKSVTGTSVEIGSEVQDLQSENGSQWAAMGLLGTSQSIQAAQISASTAKLDSSAKKDASQDAALAEHEDRITASEAKDKAQDAAIDGVADQLDEVSEAAQKAAAEAKAASKKNKNQDKQLANHETRIAATEASVGVNTVQIAALRGDVDRQEVEIDTLAAESRQQQAAINAHDALLSEHSAKLGALSEGIAMAMALPDTWLSDLERYAVAGNCATYDGNAACGFAFIGRLNTQWSFNVKASAPTNFNQFGATVGARYGW